MTYSSNEQYENQVTFRQTEKGLVRFPANIELLSVERQGDRLVLVATRNEIELRFPLLPEEAKHLAGLLRPNNAVIVGAPSCWSFGES